MSQAVRLPKRLTTSEYFDFEKGASVRHELVGGIIYAIVGSTDRRNIIAGNLLIAFSTHLPDACQVFEQSMKLRIATEAAEDFYYPDFMVSCDAGDRERLFREKPSILGEVLSPSTPREDRREKFAAYTQIPTLQEFVLIAQDVPQGELFRRSNAWRPEHFFLEDSVTFTSAGLTLPVEQIYRRVTF